MGEAPTTFTFKLMKIIVKDPCDITVIIFLKKYYGNIIKSDRFLHRVPITSLFLFSSSRFTVVLYASTTVSHAMTSNWQTELASPVLPFSTA